MNRNFNRSFFFLINREWYGYHFPELIKIVSDNNMYAKCVRLIKNRKEMSDDLLEQLEEVIMDSAKAQAVIDASKSSMGKLIYATYYLPTFLINH